MPDTILEKILQKNKIDNVLIKEFSGGQINHTYQIGDNYVVKIQKELDVLLHQVQLLELIIPTGAKVPKIVDFGFMDGKEYIVMEKIRGRKLSECWHLFRTEQKENFIAQIASQLKLIHSISFDLYSPQRPKEFGNWKDAIVYHTDFSVVDGKRLDRDTADSVALLKQYFQKHQHVLDETGGAVLIHNDLHFENILFEDGEITGVLDFDFARQAPKDYELWHLIDFFHTPVYFVEEDLECVWKEYQYANEIKHFKRFYPELFIGNSLLERLRIYFMEEILSTIADGFSSRGNHQVESYFKNGWLEDVLRA